MAFFFYNLIKENVMRESKSFIKVYNSLFDYKLSSSAFVVYLYLSDISRHTGSAKVRYQVIANKCNISPKTAYRAVHELISYELIEKTHRFNENYYFASNSYKVKQLFGGYSKLDRRVLNLQLDPGSLYVLCAINKFANYHSLAFPSYSKIAEETGLSRTTAIRKVAVLQGQGLITKESRLSEVFFDYISNAYAVVSMETRAVLMALALKAKQIMQSIAENSIDNAFTIFKQEYYFVVVEVLTEIIIANLYIRWSRRLNI